MARSFDAVIVGAGHNGLVCGAYLAKAGLRVCVLERRSVVGGAATTEEVWPGYRVSTASYVMGLLQPKIILDLELARFGYEVIEPTPLLQPFPDGRHIVFWREPCRLAAEFAKFSPDDAAVFPRYRRTMLRFGSLVQRLLWEAPPDLPLRGPRDLYDFLRFVWRFRGFAGDFHEIWRLLTMSAFDYLQRWFSSDAVKLAIGFYAAGGGGQRASMKTPGTAFMLARSCIRNNDTPAGSTGFVRGGMGGISDAIAASGRSRGLEIRTSAPVAAIQVKNGNAMGVALESGEEIAAPLVIANASAQTTFLDLVEPAALPEPFLSDIRSLRARSTGFKVHLAVDRLPRYRGFDAAELGFPYPTQVRIAPDIAYMEAAFADAEHGRNARHPYLTVTTQSVLDPGLAPDGKHIISIYGGHAVSEALPGDRDRLRQEMTERVLAVFGAYASDVSEAILHHQTLMPWDLERIFGLPGGHVHHFDMSADQMFSLRPAPGFARYRSPINGLYICSASAHPGGGVTGVPGHNAARTVLRDLKRRMKQP
jgi:phytoene dehydrogenase-like protein